MEGTNSAVNKFKKGVPIQRKPPQYSVQNDLGDPEIRQLIVEWKALETQVHQNRILLKRKRLVDRQVEILQGQLRKEQHISDELVDQYCKYYLQARSFCSNQQDLPPFDPQTVKDYAARKNKWLQDKREEAALYQEIKKAKEMVIAEKKLNSKLSIAEQIRKGTIRTFCRICPLTSGPRSAFIEKQGLKRLILTCKKDPLHMTNTKSKATSLPKDPHQPSHASSIKSNSRSISLPKKCQNLQEDQSDRNLFKSKETIQHEKKSHIQNIYDFDLIFSQDAGQEQVFEELEPVISLAVNDKKVCVFSYGQTGSGKTYTMLGSRNNFAIAPRALKKLFDLLQQQEDLGWEYQMKISADELTYQGKYDLFSNKKLGIKERIGKIAKTKDEAFDYLWEAIKNRTTSETKQNTTSSRSHLILTIEVQKWKGNSMERGVLCLTELAASENMFLSINPDESRFINNTLSSLKSYFIYLKTNQAVCSAKTELTEALEDHLKKDTLTLVIVCISPNLNNLQISKSTAEFGQIARAIVKKK